MRGIAQWIRISGKHRPAPLEPKCGEQQAPNEMKGLRADVRDDSMVRRLSANFYAPTDLSYLVLALDLSI